MKQWEILGLCLVLAIIVDLIFMYLLKKSTKYPTQKNRHVFSIEKIKNCLLGNLRKMRYQWNLVKLHIHHQKAPKATQTKEVVVSIKPNKKRITNLGIKMRLLFKRRKSKGINLMILNKKQMLFISEILLLLGFAMFVGRPYLNMDSDLFITGGEFTFASISHSVWNLLPKCGTCVFWNGFLNGGSPSFAELHGAFLHPLVILTTLFWNLINGSKILLLICFFMTGFGQWWLARELNIGFVGRMWSGLLAITGGHLFGRLETGNVILVLSIASASLLIPMIIRFKKFPNNRNIVIFALLFSLTWLAGQGYVQLVVTVSFLPVFLWYLYKKSSNLLEKWKPFIKTVILSLILSAVLIIPVIHFSRNIDKVNNVDFADIQPLEYNVLNLVIHDLDFFHIDTLGKNSIAYIHINHIGWIPILLLALSLAFIQNSKIKKELVMLYAIIILVFIFSSKELYVLLGKMPLIPQLRSIGLTASLAIQPILGIAAFSLNKLVENKWDNINFEITGDSFRIKPIPLKWLLIVLILFFSIKNVYEFGRNFISVSQIYIPEEEIQLLDTDDSQWVQGLNSDWDYKLINQYKKVIMPGRPWYWKNHPVTNPYLEVRHNPEKEILSDSILHKGEIDLLFFPENIYAAVINHGDKNPCEATAYGGKIDIWCDTSTNGTLLVRENYWKGWQVWVDGERAKFVPDDWLSVMAPAGKHLYQFRYRPWDVYVGMGLTLFGLILCVHLWRSNEELLEDVPPCTDDKP